MYKYIMSQSMEDDSIVTFIQHLQQDSQGNQQILTQLNDIAVILNKKKNKQYKQESQSEKIVKQLKKELSKAHEQRKSFLDQTQQHDQQSYYLKAQLKSLNTKIEEIQRQSSTLLVQNQSIQTEMNKITKQKDIMAEQIKEFHKSIKSISESLSFKSQEINQDEKQKITNHLSEIKNRVKKLSKYRQLYKKEKESNYETDFIKRQITLLKLFLSQEALSLLKEYESTKLECLESQIRNLAIFQKNKLLKLQDTEKEVWRFKIKLLKENYDFNQTASHSSSWKRRLSLSGGANHDINYIAFSNQSQQKVGKIIDTTPFNL